jgi:NitT/TauT family transport system ATP-binding protein
VPGVTAAGEREPSADPLPAGVRVRASGVVKAFGSGAVLDGIDLDVAAGSFVALLGPSGCGKSTFLRLVAGLDAPDAGILELSAGKTGTRVAFVFQDPQLLPWRTVLENAALPLELSGVSPTTRREAAARILAQVGLADAAARMPHELSGGMRMRVSLARALVTEPTLLLLDEPFAALDEMTRQRLDDQLRTLWKRIGATILFVTHSVDEAAYLAERVIVLSPRPAHIVGDHAMSLPAERAVALRTEPEFSREVRALRSALEHGGA